MLDDDQGATSDGPLGEVDSQTDRLAAAEEPVAWAHTEIAVKEHEEWSCIEAAGEEPAMYTETAVKEPVPSSDTGTVVEGPVT
jgi:hypothetical protein